MNKDWLLEESSIKKGEEIGSGCFGRVYKATMHGVQVALKLCKLVRREAKVIPDMVEKEVNIHAALHYPNRVQFKGFLRTKSAIRIVSEYMDSNLEVVIFGGDDGHGKLTMTRQDQIAIILQCMQGLSYLHAQNVIHSDIKPANILISSDLKTVKICDMGLSRVKSRLAVTKTKSSVPSTIMYIAPESLMQKVRANRMTDVWSMCATGAEVLTGSDFWNIGEEDPETAIRKKMKKKSKPDAILRAKNKKSKELLLLGNGLNYDANKRPSALELFTECRKFLKWIPSHIQEYHGELGHEDLCNFDQAHGHPNLITHSIPQEFDHEVGLDSRWWIWVSIWGGVETGHCAWYWDFVMLDRTVIKCL